MKKLKKALAITLIFIFASFFPCLSVFAIDSTSEAFSGDGSAENPYVYIADPASKVTWKHLNDVKSGGLFEKYEIRDNNSPEGKLRYSWLFSHESITVPEGPYFLGINRYSGDSIAGLFGEEGCLYFSFAHKRDLPGKAEITLDVSDTFQDGTVLRLYSYGGYDSTMVHGDSPVILPEEIREVDSLKEIADSVPISNGAAVFSIRYGGNYILSNWNLSEEQSSPQTVATNAADGTESVTAAPPASQKVPLLQLFKNDKIAGSAAVSLGKSVTDSATREDIGGIKKLFLQGMGLTELSDLAGGAFERLESLDASGNSLTVLDNMNLPMLESLNLSENRIVSTDFLSSLPMVENVNFSKNKLIKLPDITFMKNLTTLNCSDNQITGAEVESSSLRYINISGNAIIGRIDLSKCPNLEEFSIGEQQLSVSATLADDSEFVLNPIPELIEQYGERATVKIFTGDKSDTCVDELDYADLKKQNYRLDFSKYKSSSAYHILITGYYNGSEVLGNYTYYLSDPNYKKHNLTAFIAGLALLVIVILLIFKIKRWNML